MGTEGCGGSCCVAINLSVPYETLKAEPERFMDGAYILDMLITLTPEEAEERAEQFGVELVGGPHFACRHWNEITRLCNAYEQRPRMCSGYPYQRDGGCEFGCECKGLAPGATFPPIRGEAVSSRWPGLYRIQRIR